MNEYNRLLLNDLENINNLIEKSTNIEEKEILNNDKKILLYETNKIVSLGKKSISSFNLMQDDFNEIIINNSLYRFYLPSLFSLKHSNSYDNKIIFKKFLNEDKFELLNIYNKLNLYNGIIYTSDGLIDNQYVIGKTIYIRSLKKSYIVVKINNRITDYSTLIHELGHAKQNLIGSTMNIKHNKSSFSEAYPIFLELQFLNYIKECGLKKESYSIRRNHILGLLSTMEILYETLGEYKNMTSSQKEGFHYSLNLMLSTLLATYFMEMYNIDSIQCLKKIKLFLNNYDKMDDKQLLSSIGLSFKDFNNNDFLANYINSLKKEKIKIKKKI